MTKIVRAMPAVLYPVLLAGQIQISGNDLAWRVETSSLVVNMEKNPGTGRNGQINTIFYKAAGVLLSRDRTSSTVHLSPNSAAGPRWEGINRWDPPKKYTATPGPHSFRLEREGEMPFAPNLYVKTSYEVLADQPVIGVEESIEARQDAEVTLLRLCEWSFAPGKDNVFTELAWEDLAGKVTSKAREKEEVLPLELRWMAFMNREKRFGFAAVVEQFEPGPVLVHPLTRFAGDPHYFYCALIYSPDYKLVMVPRGTRCSMRYSVLLFEPEEGSHALDPVVRFRRAKAR